jgi:hypothetical protein
MRSATIRLGTAILAAATIAAGPLAVSALASPARPHHAAVSGNCANGIYAGYDGTQQNENGQSIVVRGSQVLAASSHAGASACFFWFAYNGGPTKIAEYAPGGIASNLVLAPVLHGKNAGDVTLQKADGSLYDQWVFAPGPDYGTDGSGSWTNAGLSAALTVGSHGQLEVTSGGTISGASAWTWVPAP